MAEIFNAARDNMPLHAEASGHPKVGSSDSTYDENIADTSKVSWKTAKSKWGKGRLDDFTEGSDDEFRNEVTDDLDFRLRR